jgi:hypothetical protein
MTEKVRKLSIFLQTLSRIPGLGFLRDAENQMRESADMVDDMGDSLEDGRRQVGDIRRAARDVATEDEET